MSESIGASVIENGLPRSPNSSGTAYLPAGAEEVSWLSPCYVCGGTEGCLVTREAVICTTLDNGLGRRCRLPGGQGGACDYDLATLRHIPPVDVAVQLLRDRFLNRTDVVAYLAPWGKPCPAVGDGNLDALLGAHVLGPQSRRVRLQWRSKRNSGVVEGAFRIGAYTPAPDGTAKWLCIDFDGGGEHSAPLAEPLAVAMSVQALAYRVGLSPHLEQSGGGRGWHLWLFFARPIPAKTARALGFALAPYDALLADGSLANPHSAKGIEVFPKCDAIQAGGVGNPVWLPWYFGAKRGGNLFYRQSPRWFEPFVPEYFDTNTTGRVDRALALLAIRAGQGEG